jgi:hypothetical protein
MHYPDHVTQLQLVREHQAELRKQSQPRQREQDTERPLAMAVLSRGPVDRLTTRKRIRVRPVLAAAAALAAAATLLVATSTAPAGSHAVRSASSATLDPRALAHARKIRFEITARYVRPHGPKLAVTEASSTGVLESFTLWTARLDEARTVPADNGVYFAICPVRATCPYPTSRFARPAADFLPRRQALELALRTFLETSATVVAVSLPTPRFILFVVERDELAREVEMAALASALSGDPAHAPAAWLHRVVDQVTRPRTFVPLGMEPTSAGRDTFTAVPRWPTMSVGGEGNWRASG